MQFTVTFLGILLVSVTSVLCETQRIIQSHPSSILNTRNHANNPLNPQPQQPAGIPIPMPRFPVPNCGFSFPGGPQWKACFEKFNENMRTFQHQMQLYSQQVAHQAASAHANPDTTMTSMSHSFAHSNVNGLHQQQHITQASSSSHTVQYTSSASSQGYSVKTFGIPISTMKRGSTMNIKLVVGPYNDFQTRTEGKEIIMEMKTLDGVRKGASLKLPEGVTQAELKIERSPDAIMIIGPIKPNHHGGGSSHSSSSSSSSSFAGNGINFPNFGGQWSTAAGDPPVANPGINPPMPFIGVPNIFPPIWFF